MKTQKTYLSHCSVLLSALCVLSASAQAASDNAVINVTGKILANTCTLDAAGSDLSPTLAPISERDLRGKGTVAGQKTINIALKDCGADAGNVEIKAQGDVAEDDEYAFKNAAATGATTGVGLYFYQTDGTTRFKADGSVIETVTSLTPSANNTLEFSAAYVSTAEAPSAGDFKTQVNLTLTYQ